MQEKELIERLVETEQRSKTNAKRIDDLEIDMKNIQDLTIAVKTMATEMKNLTEVQADMNNRLKAIEKKPAQTWDKVTTTIITTVVSALAGAFIALILR